MAALAVLHRDPAPGPVREGGRARRAGLLAALSGEAEVHHLAVACRGSPEAGDPDSADAGLRPAPTRASPAAGLVARLYPYLLALAHGLAVALHTEARRLLVFYPDLPGIHPARWWKLPLVLPWLGLLRAVLSARGIRLLVDVGDVPRWQCRSLNLPLPMRPGLHRLLELVLFSLADRVLVATPELADRLARDLVLVPDRFAVLPNAAARVHRSRRRAARREDRARFIYLGNLDAGQDRGIRALCEAFVTGASGSAELVLIGEGGGWIQQAYRSRRLRVLPPQPEESCARWLARSDFALIPYPTGGYYRTVSPIKLPLYALSRVPILSTPLEATKRVIEAHGLGECLDLAQAFRRWPELSRRYRGFRGGRDLAAFTWDANVGLLLSA